MDERTAIDPQKAGLRLWKKGQSGNPTGRPRVESRIRKLAQRHSRSALHALVRLLRSKNERIVFMAANAVLDRAIGKPAQSVALSGPDGEPLRLTAPVPDALEAARIYAAVLGGTIDAASVEFSPAALAAPARRQEPIEAQRLPPLVESPPIDGESHRDALTPAADPSAPRNVVDIWQRLNK